MDKVLGMLGMAKRAGKVISGSFLCERAVREKQSALILIAADMSENAKQDIIRLCGRPWRSIYRICRQRGAGE